MFKIDNKHIKKEIVKTKTVTVKKHFHITPEKTLERSHRHVVSC